MIWLSRQGEALISADDEAKRAIGRMEHGEAWPFKPLKPRSLKWHRRYWLGISRTWPHVDEVRIDVGGGHFIRYPINSDTDLHSASKLLTGLYDVRPIEGTDFAMRFPKSTSFDEMTADEWAKYYPKVQDAMFMHVIPLIGDPILRAEIERLWS